MKSSKKEVFKRVDIFYKHTGVTKIPVSEEVAKDIKEAYKQYLRHHNSSYSYINFYSRHQDQDEYILNFTEVVMLRILRIRIP